MVAADLRREARGRPVRRLRGAEAADSEASVGGGAEGVQEEARLVG